MLITERIQNLIEAAAQHPLVAGTAVLFAVFLIFIWWLGLPPPNDPTFRAE